LIAIRPKGVPYERLSVKHIDDYELDRQIVEGELRPSSDLPGKDAYYSQEKTQ